MQPLVTFDRADDLSDADRSALRVLSLAVYPPDVAASWPGRHLEWARPEWRIRVFEEGRLVSSLGALVRHATHDGRPVLIGGMGGVATHPEARRRGYAALAARRAHEFFLEHGEIAFSLLVCEPGLIEYYGRLGWREFDGRLMVRQRGERAEFTFNRVMLRAVNAAAPSSGVIDLLGPPW